MAILKKERTNERLSLRTSVGSVNSLSVGFGHFNVYLGEISGILGDGHFKTCGCLLAVIFPPLTFQGLWLYPRSDIIPVANFNFTRHGAKMRLRKYTHGAHSPTLRCFVRLEFTKPTSVFTKPPQSKVKQSKSELKKNTITAYAHACVVCVL